MKSFEKARAFVHALELKSKTEWGAYCRGDMPEKGTRPYDIPGNPHRAYKDKGWIHWPDWFGKSATGTPKNIEWRPFEEARAFMHALELKSQKEWRAYRRGDMPGKGIKPPDIPGNPHRVYKDKGWISWSDWVEKTKPSLIN